MPNTLVHLGVQGAATRALAGAGWLRWAYLGAVLPDLPWILHRISKAFAADIDRLDLRLYCVVQASLVLCLLGAAACAQLSRQRWRAFLILGAGALLHLLLDSIETRWGNGVHLLAPWSWRSLDLSLFWPENPLVAVLGVAGLAFVLLTFRSATTAPLAMCFAWTAWIRAAALLLAYLLLPLALTACAERADVHGIATLRAFDQRAGRAIELHKAYYYDREEGDLIETLAGEPLRVLALDLDHDARVSVRGRFEDSSMLAVADYHQHRAHSRDVVTVVGLALACGIWIVSLARAPSRETR